MKSVDERATLPVRVLKEHLQPGAKGLRETQAATAFPPATA
jgi:hypothetical protein